MTNKKNLRIAFIYTIASFLVLIFALNIFFIYDDIKSETNFDDFNDFTWIGIIIWGILSFFYVAAMFVAFIYFRKIHSSDSQRIHIDNDYASLFLITLSVSSGVFSISSIVFSIGLGQCTADDKTRIWWIVLCFVSYFIMLYIIVIGVFSNHYQRTRQNNIIEKMIIENYHYTKSRTEKKVANNLFNEQNGGKITRKEVAKVVPKAKKPSHSKRK